MCGKGRKHRLPLLSRIDSDLLIYVSSCQGSSYIQTFAIVIVILEAAATGHRDCPYKQHATIILK